MRSIGSYLLLMFMVMFWVFRIVVAVCATLGFDIGFLPLNTNIEIILLFVTFICVILVGKRKLLGGILYLVIRMQEHRLLQFVLLLEYSSVYLLIRIGKIIQ